MRAGGAGRGNRVIDAFDAERGSQAGRHRTRHGLCHPIRANALDAFLAQQVYSLDLVGRRRPARARDDPRALVAHLFVGEAGVFDGAAHRDVGVSGGIAHKAQLLAVDEGGKVHRWPAGHPAPEATLCVLGRKADARAPLAQRLGDAFLGVAQARHNAHASDDDASHASPFCII